MEEGFAPATMKLVSDEITYEIELHRRTMKRVSCLQLHSLVSPSFSKATSELHYQTDGDATEEDRRFVIYIVNSRKTLHSFDICISNHWKRENIYRKAYRKFLC